MAESGGEKTEPATPYRRQKAREEGRVVKSQELSSIFIMFMGAVTIKLLSDFFFKTLQSVFTDVLGFATVFHYSPLMIRRLELLAFEKIFTVAGLIMMVVFISAIMINIIQIGPPILSFKAIAPKLDKLNPINGFKKVFSTKGFMELFKALVKIGLVGTVAIFTISKTIENIVLLPTVALETQLMIVGHNVFLLVIRVLLLLLFLAFVDYGFQKHDFEKGIKMSKQEIKDEYKQQQGDPVYKSKRKAKHQQLAMQRMMQDMMQADAIITNPTHYAVAIKYEEKDPAPKIIAKGKDYIAAKIKQKAKDSGIPIFENPKLARGLYFDTEIGDLVPDKYFKAIAKILATVYKTQGKV